MPRARFQTTAGELAARFDLALRGDPAQAIDGVGTLAGAGPTQLSFLANPKYRGQLAQSAAGLVVMRAADAEGHGGNALVAADPYVAYARIAALFDDAPAFDPGIHPSAAIDPAAEVDPGASIGPFVSVGAGSRIAAGARLPDLSGQADPGRELPHRLHRPDRPRDDEPRRRCGRGLAAGAGGALGRPRARGAGAADAGLISAPAAGRARR